MDSENLQRLLAKKAQAFAAVLAKAAERAQTEADVRTAFERQLALLSDDIRVTIEGKHEYSVARGRIDSVYNLVLIEYKNPKSPSARIGESATSPGTRAVVSQIRDRFEDVKGDAKTPAESLFGVGTDGRRIVFVRYRHGDWRIEDPVPVTETSITRLLWALFNTGRRGRALTPEALAADFGADSDCAKTCIQVLYQRAGESDHPKLAMLFAQWKILFSEVCGFNLESTSDKVKKLAEAYGVGGRALDGARFLFALHTYYALLMKLLASGVVAFFHRLPSPVDRIQRAQTSEKLKEELQALEDGGVFRHLQITNFLEGDLFTWYLSAWTREIADGVRQITVRLDEYNPGTLSEDPTGSRDLLKHLYQQLFPRVVRHDLGEYYTPDWLADYTLDEVGYEGDPRTRLLDPACGSGTFLVLALNRARAWYEEHREESGLDEKALWKLLQKNIVGFDLNPLAVLAARTNYLVAVRDFIGHAGEIEIPVYNCDSVLTPGTHDSLLAGSAGESMELKTAGGVFYVPSEVTGDQDALGRYAGILEGSLGQDYDADQFVERCRVEGLPVTSLRLHRDLYEQLRDLKRQRKNGVWARIIRNFFAPVFLGRVDFVTGNPPWINWESLPKEYRDDTTDLWDRYGLRYRSGASQGLGNVKRELSSLFLYTCIDHYLGVRGRLAFVLTQSLLKTGANEGFRRFRYSRNATKHVELKVRRTTDFSLCQPFEYAVNRTAVLAIDKGSKHTYPVDYRLWVPEEKRFRVPEADLAEVKKAFTIARWAAKPVEPSVPESTWLTAEADVLPLLSRIVGDQDKRLFERTYAGTCTWLSGVYWLALIQVRDGLSLIRNLGLVGKKKVPIREGVAVESRLLYPLLRGRDVSAWRATSENLIIVPHDPEDFGEPLSLTAMRTRAPKAAEYFSGFQRELKGRSGYKQLMRSRPEYYAIGNVGNYTLTDYKVVFKDLTEFFQCAVVGPGKVGETPVQPTIPDHSLLFLAARSANEAHFIAAILNSWPVRAALYCCSVGVQTQRYFPVDVARVAMPEFDPKDHEHVAVASLSTRCHRLAETGGPDAAEEQHGHELAHAVGPLFGLGRKETQTVIDFYERLLELRGASVPVAVDAEDETD